MVLAVMEPKFRETQPRPLDMVISNDRPFILLKPQHTVTMSAPRALHPRLLRFGLSRRYQNLQRRHESTARLAPNPTPTATVSQQPVTPPTFFKRYRSAIIWGTLSLTLGAIGGQFVVHTVAPPPLPEPGSREDAVLLADLNRQIDEHFKVKVLKGKCLGMAKQLKGEEGGWFEVIPQPEETKKVDGSVIAQLQGARGLGVERVFWEKGEQKLVAVVYFGGSLCGWPGVTHGGCIATALAEKLSLAMALANERNNNDVMAAAAPQRLPGTGNHAKMLAPARIPDEPAQLSLTYLKPTFANKFYVIRVQPAIAASQDSILESEPLGGADYEATLETQDGKISVKARAKFRASTALERVQEKAATGVARSYDEFKEWMWPSRQKQSQLG